MSTSGTIPCAPVLRSMRVATVRVQPVLVTSAVTRALAVAVVAERPALAVLEPGPGVAGAPFVSSWSRLVDSSIVSAVGLHGGMDDLELRTEADAILAELVGDSEGSARLREDQWQAVAALVEERRRALVVQRTGWGKSAVYFVATALLRRRGSGPTVIISPLLALMRNQVESAARAGIQARTINSANPEEWDTIYGEVERGETDVLLVSPERLNSVDFRDQVLPKLAATTGLLVVDEAHCISDWGHDFRPDYRRLRTMLTELPVGVPVLATTATANARVTADVAEQLGTGVGMLWFCGGRWTGRACGWGCWSCRMRRIDSRGWGSGWEICRVRGSSTH